MLLVTYTAEAPRRRGSTERITKDPGTQLCASSETQRLCGKRDKTMRREGKPALLDCVEPIQEQIPLAVPVWFGLGHHIQAQDLGVVPR